MALLMYSTISGLHDAYASTVGSAVESGLISNLLYGPQLGFYSHYNNYTRLAYDAEEDALLLTHNAHQSPHYIVPNWYIDTVDSHGNSHGWTQLQDTTLVFDAATLSPAVSGGTGTLNAKGASIYFMPAGGGTTGMSFDPNTRALNQAYWHYLTATLRGGGTNLNYGYGTARMLSFYHYPYSPAWTAGVWDGLVNGEQMVASLYVNEVGQKGWLYFAPGAQKGINLAPVTFDDISVVAHADQNGYAWIGCWQRPATAADSWRGGHSMAFGWPMGIAPYGVDRCITVWWAHPTYGAPLVYTIHRYDRTLARLRLEDVGAVPTTRSYGYPEHVGFVTYDMRRGHLILLSPGPDSLDQFTVGGYCHPGAALAATAPTPLDPAHAGLAQRYIVATMTGETMVGTPAIAVSYTSFSSTAFTRTTAQFATTGIYGQGTFAVSWASGISGASGTLTLAISTYSVGVSGVGLHGNTYGTEAMALLTSTGTFTVSSTLMTLAANAPAAGVTILARVPVSQADTVGAGSPRMLSYPTASLASPLVYTPPPVWTNFLNQALTRPLYANARSLTQTVNAQFAGHFTDLEVEEIWPGGGNRIAMALSQLAAIYEYFINPPDLASAGFITWSPRDITNRSYKVLIVSVTAGGNDSVELGNLMKTGDGWILAEVRMKLRLIEEV